MQYNFAKMMCLAEVDLDALAEAAREAASRKLPSGMKASERCCPEQFLKFKYPTSQKIQALMLSDDRLPLAGCVLVQGWPEDNYVYGNEVQCFVKGFGRKLVEMLLARHEKFWFVASWAGGPKLCEFYRSFPQLEESVARTQKMHEVHIFSQGCWKDRLLEAWSG